MDLCSKGLHERTAENLAGNGACKACRRLRERRKAGASLCWTGAHPEPDEGLICACGEAPPPPDWLDWAAVEDAVAGRKLVRDLTNAETVSALRTIQRRYSVVEGPYQARDVLAEAGEVILSDARVRYLMWEWDTDRNTPDATQAFMQEVSPD